MAVKQKSFPSQIELTRILTLQKYQKLYDNDQQSVLPLHEKIKKQFKKGELIYLAHAIPAKISDFFGDFVQGDASRLVIGSTGENEDEQKKIDEIVEGNDLIERIYDFAVDQSEFGYEVLLGRVDDDKKFIIEDIPQEQYFPQKDGSVIFASYIRDPNDSNPILTDRTLFLYTQHYQLNDKNVLIEREVFKSDANGAIDSAASLSDINLEDVEESETIEGLDELPIVQIDNGRKTKWGFGKSDYSDIMPQLAEINERRTHTATQLLKNLDAILETQKLPDEARNADGSLKTFDTIERGSKDDPESRYITNENALLDDLREHVTEQLKMVSWLSAVPMFTLLKLNMPERVESMKIQLFDAVRRTDTKRAKVIKGVRKMIKIGFKMLDGEMKDDISITFSDVLPVDRLVESQIEETKVNSGLSSRRTAMQRLENYDEDELDEEVKRIESENIASGAVNPDNAPTV